MKWIQLFMLGGILLVPALFRGRHVSIESRSAFDDIDVKYQLSVATVCVKTSVHFRHIPAGMLHNSPAIMVFDNLMNPFLEVKWQR